MPTSADNNKPILFFDGKCNLCNASVDFVVRWDKKNIFFVSALQGQTALQLLTPDHRQSLDTIVLLWGGKTLEKSSAAIRVAANLRWYFKPLYLLLMLPPLVRDSVYSYVSKNRYRWFGKKETCRVPTQKERSYFLP